MGIWLYYFMQFNICMAVVFLFLRMFLPDLKEYFEEAVDQADPGAQIEEQYK